MANTLTGLIPTLYESLDIVSREMVGFIPAVSIDAKAERVALNQTVLVPIAPAAVLGDNTPAVTAPTGAGQVISTASMTVSRTKYAAIPWGGEEQRGLIYAGTYNDLLRNQFAQGFRALVNLMEQDLFTVTYQAASRAVGTPGTTPFATAANLSDAANLRRVLDDNGAPQSDLQLVMGSAAVANLRGQQTILLKVNEAGTDSLLRRGDITAEPLDGFRLHNSNAVQVVAPGGGSGYVTSGATAAGVNTLALITGTGNVNAGDVVTFAVDTNNKYVVNTGVTGPGTLGIGAPGAKIIIPSGNAMTSGAAYTPNVGFSKSAVYLLARKPAMPVGPDGKAMDMADDIMEITDPFTGITFEIAVYRQFMQLVYHVRLAWGTAAVKPNHIAILQG